jgi:hypothetical protein
MRDKIVYVCLHQLLREFHVAPGNWTAYTGCVYIYIYIYIYCHVLGMNIDGVQIDEWIY